MKAGAISSFSVGFYASEIKEERSADGGMDVIEKGDLVETSVVLRPANPGAELVSVRAVPMAAPAVDPGAVAGIPGAGTVEGGLEEEEKPTRAGVLSKIGELVELAMELNMEADLPKIVGQYVKLLAATPGQEQAPPPPAAPGAPAAPAAPAPVGRAMSEGLRIALSEMGI